jgi:hypothetical protein
LHTNETNDVNAYDARLKQWLARFNCVATKNLPNYLGWGGAASKPRETTSLLTPRSKAPSPTVHTNSWFS